MKQKVTIRDVAEQAGVSISTVHQALNGKTGVSGTTRDRIRQIAEELGYQPNSIASSLKRKTRYIAIVMPSEGGNNRYYYPPIWRGVRDYLNTATDMNLECTEISYYENTGPTVDILDRLRGMLEQERLDGILTVGHMSAVPAQEWNELRQHGVAVAMMGSNNAKSGSICCVQPNYPVIGRTMAELITGHIPSFGSILMCCGNPHWQAHSQVVQGFDDYMYENGCHNKIYRDCSWDMTDGSYRNILQQLSRPDVAACCSVLSQSSVLMGRALEESGKAGHIFAVGSDLSDENIDRMNRRIFNNLIQKNPYAQGYLAAKALVEYLVLGKRPEQENCYVGCEVIFRSNLEMYENGGYRALMF